MQEPVRVLVRCALPGPMRVTQVHIKPHAPRHSCHAEPDRCPSPTCKLIDDGIVNLDGCMPIGHVEQHREPGRALHECAEHLCPRCRWTDRSSPHTSSSFLEGSHGAPITSNRPTTHGYTTMRDATHSRWQQGRRANSSHPKTRTQHPATTDPARIARQGPRTCPQHTS